MMTHNKPTENPEMDNYKTNSYRTLILFIVLSRGTYLLYSFETMEHMLQ